MSKIDLYKGECSEAIDKARKIFNKDDLEIFFARDIGQYAAKDDKKFDTSRFAPFKDKQLEDTAVEKGL